MVINKKYNTDFASTWEILGESTDTKPTLANSEEKDVPPDMSIFLEFDTGELYYYRKSTDSWQISG